MQKTEIEIELSETIAYSRPTERFQSFCQMCNSMVEMASTQIAAIVTRSSEREIYRLIETGDVHFVETDRVLVCLSSITELQRLAEQPQIIEPQMREPKQPELKGVTNVSN